MYQRVVARPPVTTGPVVTAPVATWAVELRVLAALLHHCLTIGFAQCTAQLHGMNIPLIAAGSMLLGQTLLLTARSRSWCLQLAVSRQSLRLALNAVGASLPHAWLPADTFPWDKWLADNHGLSASQAFSKSNHFTAFPKHPWSYTVGGE